MESLTSVLNTLDSFLGSAFYFPFVLLATGIFFTFYLKFPQIRFFNHAWRILRGKYEKPGSMGDASHFQALSTAISGTVGTGNIGGVALAIFLGGPAALFWMWMTAFFGMTTKFVEVSLSHKYRTTDELGFIVGGPMYVMEHRLNMKWLAIFFAIATVISSFGTGNLPQSNSIATGVSGAFGVPEWITGGILAIILALVILGGIRRIVLVAEKIVPFMAVVYFVGALGVILVNLENIGPSFLAVFQDAFSGSAAVGGFLGAGFAYAFNRGVNRGLFSNEAGQGSAPIAHAAARADEPVSEGMVSILEPFIDTIIICTLTGLVILSTGVWSEKHENNFQQFDMEFISGQYSDQNEEQKEQLLHYLNNQAESSVEAFDGTIEIIAGNAVTSEHTVLHNRSIAEDVKYYLEGTLYTGPLYIEEGKLTGDVQVSGRSLVHSVDLTSEAFSRGVFGEYGRYIVAIGLVLFAFTTSVAWSYYGDRAMTYLFGVRSVLPYRIIYVASFFTAAVVDTSLVWLIAAITVTFMTLPNLFTILLLHKEMKQIIADYWEKFHREYPD
ncbi:MAG: sodium:alanine symporter family protein [Gammaproteobacteria bacterium]|nr:sodium:alanine symporter family protein [Gammaproteobacteria bacterium]